VASKFGSLCASLVAARREDARALAQRLAVAERDQKAAETALKEQMDTISEKDALIARYEALLGQGQK
jgi:alpha/beta superfamily hydrolase